MNAVRHEITQGLTLAHEGRDRGEIGDSTILVAASHAILASGQGDGIRSREAGVRRLHARESSRRIDESVAFHGDPRPTREMHMKSWTRGLCDRKTSDSCRFDSQEGTPRRGLALWELACLMAFQAACLAVLWTQVPVTEELRVKTIRVVDAEGNTVMRIGSNAYGGGELVMLDVVKRGMPRLVLATETWGTPVVRLLSGQPRSADHPGSELLLTNEGEPGSPKISLQSASLPARKSVSAIELFIENAGTPTLRAVDGNGDPRLTLPSSK